jgi:hypothetical protein
VSQWIALVSFGFCLFHVCSLYCSLLQITCCGVSVIGHLARDSTR